VGRVKFVDGGDQPEGALLDEVLEAEAAVGVALGDGDDEAQVRVDHRLLRLLHVRQLLPEASAVQQLRHLGALNRVLKADGTRPLVLRGRARELALERRAHAVPPHQLLHVHR
jgi:hypothetical protein